LGVFLVFFWSPVTGSKEQRSAKDGGAVHLVGRGIGAPQSP
jgi:hypothetical protein